jgi:hypothetical protein
LPYKNPEDNRRYQRNWQRLKRSAEKAVEHADAAINKASAASASDHSPTVEPNPTGRLEPIEPQVIPSPLIVEVEAEPWEAREIEDPGDLLLAVSHEINRLLAYPSMDEAIRARSLAPLLNVAVTIMDKTKIGKELEELREIAAAREREDAAHQADKI